MEEENIPQGEDEDVEAHHFTRPGPEEPGRRALNEEDDDEVEAHHFTRPAPDEPGRRA